ncbi:hypothetical protein N665_2060s0007 [Sinapis alba]|nr:hypothetical protein N665_2060s0007 [Sinapis alba]
MSFFLKRKPASLVLIGDIDPAKDCYKIKVKVLKLWNTWKNSKIVSIELVLVDTAGTRIHDSMDECFLGNFRSKLSHRDFFILSNFTIGDYTTKYGTNPLPFKINFYRTTKITSCDDFPKKLSNNYFKDFKEILGRQYEKEVLIDVIGEVVNVGPLEDLKAEGKSIPLFANDTRLVYTLWSGYAKQVLDFFKSNEASCIVFVARFVCVREFRGAVTVSNVVNATEILFDPQLQEVLDFKSITLYYLKVYFTS